MHIRVLAGTGLEICHLRETFKPLGEKTNEVTSTLDQLASTSTITFGGLTAVHSMLLCSGNIE
jgi:hypothetical protein